MQITHQQFAAAQNGEIIEIEANRRKSYLLSQEVYEELDEIDDGSVSNVELNMLADEAHTIISQSETDESQRARNSPDDCDTVRPTHQ